MSYVKVTNIQNAGSSNINMVTDTLGNVASPGTVVMGSSYLRNKFINGGFAVDQRNAGAAQTITAAAALAYTTDRWFAYCTGANVTGQRVAGAVGQGQYKYQFTGAASVTGISIGQRIEALNAYDLAGTTATLSVSLSNSLLTTVTWTASYATTADTFGTVASPTVTQIATGTFTVSSTLSQYSVNIAVPAAAVTGIQVVFSVGAQTSGTFVVANAQLEQGTVATPFERKIYSQQLVDCQRYYATTYAFGIAYNTAGGGADIPFQFPVTMRAYPTLLNIVTSGGNWTYVGVYMNSVLCGYVSGNPVSTGGWQYTNTMTGSAEL